MYGIFTYIYHKTQPHVANRKYTTHGAYGIIHVYIYIYFLACHYKILQGHIAMICCFSIVILVLGGVDIE